MKTITKTMRCITYGCGDAFDPAKFRPIKNSPYPVNKPEGGLWATPIGSDFGWLDCGAGDSIHGYEGCESFSFDYKGRFFVIDCLEDYKKVPWRHRGVFDLFEQYVDFEKMEKMGVDAIHLTLQGMAETSYSDPQLHGWDCETVLIFNPRLVRPHIKENVDSKLGLT